MVLNIITNQLKRRQHRLNSYDDKVKNRMKRMEGQLRGVLKMMEEGKDCKAVITQLSAVRSGVDRAIGLIVSQNLLECIQAAEGDEKALNDSIQEAVNLFVKSR
ncbi:metal-sensitive transcriptional regulator [Lysinibacillus antri]|uniref:Metal-sensitive transcriptional regulator n=1 Tax=Lysinibacillus antri TaxID=2498145 RepID=A0A432L895_9BACI|nr:metal-sensitive transcriptional regulator [Lysinibacillus antri]RUL48652.1 metal-sensitive transcriptional regulator [Lysinibacillus antri]TSI09755.1 metal-sensitive transcriptional regulator [Lysinibacillus sp. BW-2-10]